MCADGYLGFFTRYADDDFWSSSTLRSLGFWKAQKYFFTSWSGRYSATAAITAAEEFGPSFVRWLPTIILLLWTAALGYLLWRLALWLQWRNPLRSALLLDLLILFLTLHTTFNTGLTLYWLTGVMTYTLPIIASCACVALLQHWFAQRRRTTIPMLLFTFLACILVAGTSETFAAILFVSMLLAEFSNWVVKRTAPETRSAVRSLTRVAAVATLCAAAIMWLAPGTAIREKTLVPPPNLFAALYLAFRLGCYFVIRLVVCQWDKFLLAVLAPAVLSFHCRTERQPSRIWLVLLPASALTLSITTFFPAAFMYFAPLAGYGLGMSQFVLVSIVAAWSYVAGCELQQRLQPGRRFANLVGSVLVLALTTIPAIVTHQQIAARTAAAEYARDWDDLERQMRLQKGKGVTDFAAEPLPWHLSNISGAEIPGIDPHFYVNGWIADYYGFKSVTFNAPDPAQPTDNWTPGCCAPLWQRFKAWRTGKTQHSN